ncbi:MAG: 5'/3'-nucleotidase SurE [Elusimicrobia bacterium]|nr:5'/3'-nucleotidase SurE [Candidatus Liberimonas magnetica]
MGKTILITNDDGVNAPGIKPLVKQLSLIARVVVVVPEYDRSAVSHSITLNKPLHVRGLRKDFYATDGTPADCVRFGIIYILKKKADLVISGINSGPNLGQDVIYSGTVAGAREAALHGVPSFAVSVSDYQQPDYSTAAKVSLNLAIKIFKNRFPEGAYLNVNVPRSAKGAKIVELGKRIYDDDIEERRDPRGRKYFWLAGKSVSGLLQAGMDVTTVDNGFVSITPLLVTPPTKYLFKLFSSWIKDIT